jgi:uncharacterized membrane protein
MVVVMMVVMIIMMFEMMKLLRIENIPENVSVGDNAKAHP